MQSQTYDAKQVRDFLRNELTSLNRLELQTQKYIDEHDVGREFCYGRDFSLEKERKKLTWIVKATLSELGVSDIPFETQLPGDFEYIINYKPDTSKERVSDGDYEAPLISVGAEKILMYEKALEDEIMKQLIGELKEAEDKPYTSKVPNPTNVNILLNALGSTVGSANCLVEYDLFFIFLFKNQEMHKSTIEGLIKYSKRIREKFRDKADWEHSHMQLKEMIFEHALEKFYNSEKNQSLG